ncbi:MAG: extensin family protein [Polyangiales bacterium]
MLPVRPTVSTAACHAALREAGVAYQSVSSAAGGVIAQPIVLLGPVGGVQVRGAGKIDAVTSHLDCRLALTLLAWAPLLRSRNVVGLEHYSMYRAEAVVGSSARASGHASGLAVDVAVIELGDGRKLSVLHDWANRARGGDPCGSWPDHDAGKLLRELVCDAAARGLFQTIVTPHHNDAHANHVHLEITPERNAPWIR